MRFIIILNDKEPRDEHIADYNVFDTETRTYYPMVSSSVALEIAELLNKNKKKNE